MVRFFLAAFSILTMIPAKASTGTKNSFPKKVIVVTVDKKGYVFIGKDTLTTIELSDELQKRLWKSYMGTDKMYDAIHLEFNGEVPMNIKESVKNAIHEGQKKALTDICLQKHEKRFEDLNSRQQGKIRKQFPVLFQQEY
jgi:biopolymer transport protein ExbD